MKYFWSLLILLLPILSQGADLDLVKTVSTTSVNTGETFTYTLQYRCASTTENCTGVMITDPLPASVEYVSLSGSVHTTNEQYDFVNHTVTFTLDDPLAAGTVGQVVVSVRFPNGSTPNGTVANNIATISGTNAASVSSSATTTAIAIDRHSISKSYHGGVPDETIVYNVKVSNSADNGTLNLTNLVVTDFLPPNAIYQSSNHGGVYDAGTNTITWNSSLLELDTVVYFKVLIVLPSSNYSVGNSVTNNATNTYTPIGEAQKSASASVTHTLSTPFIGANIEKTGQSIYARESNQSSHWIAYANTSNVPITNFYLEDNFPTGLRPERFTTGSFYSGVVGVSLTKTIKYKTNLNTTWQTVPVSTNLSTNIEYSTSSLGLASNEYITGLRWEFGPDPWPVGAGLSDNIRIYYEKIPSSTPLGMTTNCMVAGGDTVTWVNYYQNKNCHTFEVTDQPTGYVIETIKRQRPQGSTVWSSDDGPNFNSGDIVEFSLWLRNAPNSQSDILNPSMVDLLPEGLEYIDGSSSYNFVNSGFSSPTFTKVDNYNGTGKTYLRWDYIGTLSPFESAYIYFNARITNKAGSGEDAVRNEYTMLNSSYTGCTAYGGGGEKADIDDLDNDGNTTEKFCFGYSSVDIIGVPALSSEKFIKGQLDADYTKYPNFGNAVPGGVADYRLIVRNDGNVPIKEIKVVDILPFVGDAGVIDLSQRDSRWRPNLAGAVSAPSGVIVYYSTEGNPCRSAEGIEPNGPVGCNAPNWTTSVPSDITTVQSLKFDFGSFVLAPTDSIILEWPMRAPVNALQNVGNIADTIAWASFGYVGTRADNDALLLAAEPLKVGMRMEAFVPAVIGDQVWLDNNLNGIQDNNEVGLDGVRVELYRDNGDGIPDPNTDILETFTVTGNGGFYLFPNQSPDDYFVQFYLPPNHDLTTANQGGDDMLDSDVVSSTYNGFSTAITPIINLGATDINLDWDMGIYPNNKTSIGNYVWIDDNRDGIQNESANFGMNDLTVNLYQGSNLLTPFQSTTTKDDVNGISGFYEFRNLPPGDYLIELELSSINGAGTTTKGATGISDANDSDINANGRTDLFIFPANVYDDTWDMGIVFEICNNNMDDNGDGLIDCADSYCQPVISDIITTQPTCSNQTGGEIIITATGFGVLSYSITNESNWQSSNTFSNLGIGQYIIRVRNDSSCETEYTSNPIILDFEPCIEICNDGIDNDGDGLVDCDDMDCSINNSGNIIQNQ
jgi:uncharacterized repeat protein (TIGR01451 family)